jgi:protein disulfide-isomerase A6
MHHPTLCAVAVALLSALPGAQAGLYTKKSPVLQVDSKNYERLIAKSNYTSVSRCLRFVLPIHMLIVRLFS